LFDIAKKVQDIIVSVPSTIISSVNSLKEFISSFISSLKNTLDQVLASLKTGVAQLWTGIQNFANSVASTLAQVWNTLQSVAGSIVNSVSGILKGVWDTLTNVAKTVSGVFTGIVDTVKGLFTGIWNHLVESTKSIVEGFMNFGDTIKSYLAQVQNFFADIFNKLKTGVGDITFNLQGFINPLTQIYSAISTYFTDYSQYKYMKNLASIYETQAKFSEGYTFAVKHHSATVPYVEFAPVYAQSYPRTSDEVADLDKGLAGQIIDWVAGAVDTIVNKTKDLMVSVAKTFSGMVSGVVDGVKGLFGTIANIINGLISSFFPSENKSMEDNLKNNFLNPLIAGAKTGTIEQYDFMRYTVNLFAIPFVEMAGASAMLRSLGHSLLGLKINVNLQPFGIGVGGDVPINVGAYLMMISEYLWHFPEAVINTISYGYGSTAFAPLGRIIASNWRNELPVQLPDINSMTEMSKRLMPTDKFDEHLKFLKNNLMLYGYNDAVIDWYTKKVDEANITVKDRFGKDRTIPLSLIYELPTTSDMARMMVHDVFASLGDFTKAISLRGMNPDIAYMYYLLHYRYPTPDLLWQFVSRARAGMLWYNPSITDIPEVKAGIGFKPVAPKDLNGKESAVISALDTYLKWHDYAPFSWIDGFTSDKWMILDLMAELPTRIDARWMYRWRLVDPDGLRKIVVARGYHPDWVDKITIEEMMNVIREERTYARGGVMNLYSGGWMTKDIFSNKLSNLLTVSFKVGDQSYSIPVGYLPQEASLIVFRGDADRLYRLSDRVFRVVEYGVINKFTSVSNAMNVIREYYSKVANGFQLDEGYIQSLLMIADVRSQMQTLYRIRSLVRTFFYRISQLAETGEDPRPYVDTFVAKAKLTTEEKDVLYEILDIVYKRYQIKRKVSAVQDIVAGKLKRGEISTGEAIAELKKAGLTDEEALAFIENKAKFRTVSTDKLVSMMEYIPIDLSVLKKKMDAEGVPLDEQQLYLGYAISREIKTELDKYITAIGTAYVNGNISQADFYKELDNVATLWGNVKTYTGFDWIIYSPQEREIIKKVYEVKRAMKMKYGITFETGGA
jgi:prophage DNA circulation protein